MKTKNIVIVVSVLLNLILGFMVIYEKQTGNESPTDIGLSFKEAVRTENYALAKSLIAQGRKEYIPDETLKKVNDIMSSGTNFQTYELLEFDNGEMVLLNFTPNENYDVSSRCSRELPINIHEMS
ncbi:hypothetical protein [Neobacillus vireti]|uniref:DUF1310 family protein n=1 Tax=Neobacillus vireti LMG 21834 TaxID=1131730 RepID=A0AB94IMY5_9BACI|nr:hypothetical protein [Neobacillus vireti]ETI68318.1 hypothetical protein BAVI_13299 [Neobacillus vireti LMG 21834]KLT16367.1 hypothetical protein AA980_17895 [Neobacillus vireti]